MEKPVIEKLVIEKQLAQDIVNYLQTKSYVEVYQLIGRLVQSEPLDEKFGYDAGKGKQMVGDKSDSTDTATQQNTGYATLETEK